MQPLYVLLMLVSMALQLYHSNTSIISTVDMSAKLACCNGLTRVQASLFILGHGRCHSNAMLTAIATPLPWSRPLPFHCHGHGHCHSIAIVTATTFPFPWPRQLPFHCNDHGHCHALPWSWPLPFSPSLCSNTSAVSLFLG